MFSCFKVSCDCGGLSGVISTCFKGECVFSEKKKDENYVGNAALEVIQILSEKLGNVMSMGKMDAVRKAADEANFPSTVESPKDSTSLPQEAEETVMSAPTPSTLSES